MPTHPDVLILGGGVIGLTTAYYLASEGVGVSVLDQGDLGRQTSWAAAGIIPVGKPDLARSPLNRLRALSSSLFPELSQQLRAETGINNDFVACGGIELSEEDSPALQEWSDEGLTHEALDDTALHRIEPGLAPEISRGFYLPNITQLRNPRHIKALIAACENRAVGLLPSCAVSKFVREGGRITGVETDQGRLSAGQFLVATGTWTDKLLAPLGWQPGIKPIRGQIALLRTDMTGVRPVIMQFRHYLVPRLDGQLLVGSTQEDVGFHAHPTSGAIADLLAFAGRTIPTLHNAKLERCWAGLRPASLDGLPFIGQVPGWSNLFIAAGHFRSGIELSPITGIAMTELLLGRPATVPLTPFRPDRKLASPV